MIVLQGLSFFSRRMHTRRIHTNGFSSSDIKMMQFHVSLGFLLPSFSVFWYVGLGKCDLSSFLYYILVIIIAFLIFIW